jgi:uncharacterized protein YuzE
MVGMKVHYDPEGDLLEVTFSDQPAYAEEVSEDIFQRVSADGKVVGLVILHFSKRALDPLSLPLAVTAVPISEIAN